MTPLFGPRRRAESFAALADEPASGAAVRDPETGVLLELLSALRTVGTVGAGDDRPMLDEAFSLDLRERLVAEASTVLLAQRVEQRVGTPFARTRRTTGSSAPGRRRRQFATASVTLAILMGGTTGMASAAQDSLPGQVLYPVKRGLEQAAVTFSGSPVDRGRELLTQASGRLVEVQGLMGEGAAERTEIPGTLDTFNAQAREGAGLLISSYESTDDETAMVTLRNFAASSMDTIEELADAAPEQAWPEQALAGLGDAAVLMHQVDTAADQVCPGCSDLPALPSSDVLALTNAGVVDVSDTGGFVSGGTVGDPGGSTTDPLAPLLPEVLAGQELLGLPAPDGTQGSTTDPGTEAPAAPTDPDPQSPAPADPAPADPAPAEPAPAEPAPAEPAPADPAPADPAPADPAPADPAPADPAPADPAPADPAPAEPVPAEPAPAEPTPAEPAPTLEPSPSDSPTPDASPSGTATDGPSAGESAGVDEHTADPSAGTGEIPTAGDL